MAAVKKKKNKGIFGFLFRNQYEERVKRPSNWYIYLITFIIASFIAVMVVNRIWDSLFEETPYTTYTRTGAVDYRPDASHNMTVLVMLAEMKAATPEYYMLINYRPKDEVIMCIPISGNLKATVGNFTGNLNEQYDNSGADGVKLAIENAIGVTCDKYIKFDKMSFTDFVDLTGTVSVNIPYDITEGDETLFTAGTSNFNGEQLYDYMTYQGFAEGEDYQMVVQSSAITSLLNSNMRNLSTTYLQNYANKILNTTDTDFSFVDYTEHQAAFMYTSENSYNPAEYYIPYGEVGGDGYFSIASNSIITIKERIGAIGLDD